MGNTPSLGNNQDIGEERFLGKALPIYKSTRKSFFIQNTEYICIYYPYISNYLILIFFISLSSQNFITQKRDCFFINLNFCSMNLKKITLVGILGGVFAFFFGLIFFSCEIAKTGEDDNLYCVDAGPVTRSVDYDNLLQWGVNHTDSIEGGYTVFTAKWNVPAMMCPQDSVRINLTCFMESDLIRPIHLRAYLECQFGQEHNEPIPLVENDGIWTNVGRNEPWVFFPQSYYSGEEVGFLVVHVDYLVARTDNWFNDLNYLYANANDIVIVADYTGWP